MPLWLINVEEVLLLLLHVLHHVVHVQQRRDVGLLRHDVQQRQDVRQVHEDGVPLWRVQRHRHQVRQRRRDAPVEALVRIPLQRGRGQVPDFHELGRVGFVPRPPRPRHRPRRDHVRLKRLRSDGGTAAHNRPCSHRYRCPHHRRARWLGVLRVRQQLQQAACKPSVGHRDWSPRAVSFGAADAELQTNGRRTDAAAELCSAAAPAIHAAAARTHAACGVPSSRTAPAIHAHAARGVPSSTAAPAIHAAAARTHAACGVPSTAACPCASGWVWPGASASRWRLPAAVLVPKEVQKESNESKFSLLKTKAIGEDVGLGN
eukprot:PhM_4_TR7556/c0_g1_i2/m.24103